MRQIDIVPDTDVTSADRRYPVPTNRRMERWIIRTEDSAVLIRTHSVLFLDSSNVYILDDLNRQDVLSTTFHKIRHIKLSVHESTFNATDLLSVQKDIGFPIDTVEIEEQTSAIERSRNGESSAIPEVGIEKRFRDLELVVRIVRIGKGTDIMIAGEHGSRNSGKNPTLGLECRRRDQFTTRFHVRSTLQAPLSAVEKCF